MAIWTDPKVFADTNNINSTVMNTYISENMRYLVSRPADMVQLRNVGNYTTTSTTFTTVDAAALRVTIALQRTATIKYTMTGSYNIDNVNYRNVYFDVLMDGATYLSSGTATALTNGLFEGTNVAATTPKIPVSLVVFYENVAAGTHFFDLSWRRSANNLTLYTDPLLSIRVEEVG